MASLTPPDVLLFEHIPKTAGSTFRRVLRRRYGRDLVFHINVGNPQPRLDEIAAMMASSRPPRAIASHLGFGWHERLPGEGRYTHLTFLREPIERTISNYYYGLQNGRVPEGTSLVAFCSGEPGAADVARAWNVQTAFIGGLRVRQLVDGRPFRPDDYDDALLARAKANLDACAAVGLTERFEESLLLFGRTLGWSLASMRYVARNKGKRRPKRLALTDEDRAALEAANRLDLALYRYAEERLTALLAERVPDLDGRLRALRRLNRLHTLTAPNLQVRLGRHARRAARALGLR